MSGRGRGKIPKDDVTYPGRSGNKASKMEITADDRLDFFSLEGCKKTFMLPKTATGGMGIVRPTVIDVSDIKRRERDKDYAKQYQEKETQEMKASSYLSKNPRIDVTSDVTNSSPQEVHTQASQMNDIEDLSSIGGLPSLKDLSQEEYSGIYNRYAHSFRAGRYNTSLIIASSKNDIVKSINNRDVVIIAAPTGSGKTTQVPQYILEHHFKKKLPCRIVVTQPRRIAATSVARRVAEEMKVQLGTLVGYQIGMDKKSNPDTCVTFMTTGVLLQKLIGQKNMNDYTHVIIDEIHERDQETDFLMLVARKYLRFNSRNTKVILMSATIATEIYSNYFARSYRDDEPEMALVLDLEGKPNNVPEYYLDSLSTLDSIPELDIDDPRVAPECYKLAFQLIRAFDRLEKKESNVNLESRGAVLIFLPGYEHIVAMRKQLQYADTHEEKKWWILPLHSSVTSDEQHRVFMPPQPGFRKIILSTNIAESSITVSDIKYVIDFCLTKSLCLDRDTNYVSLQLEWAAKANCDQRRGRAGRVSDGRVYRLVPESLFRRFRDFHPPEMKRCPLELVILKAKKLEMGEPKAVLALALDPPDITDIEKSVLTLKEVGALGLTCNGSYTPYDGDLTFIGHVMATLPLDVKISKFILLGHVFDCLEDSIIIASCLSVMNFFSKPFAQKLQSYKAKLSWADNTFSDCFALWEAYNTWVRLREQNFFHTSGIQNESNWAKQQFVELNRLYEVHNLTTEIQKRLVPLGIKARYKVDHPQAELHLPNEDKKKDKIFILSICLCGAFYPNYFLQGDTDQNLVYRELNKKNPLDSVYLTGIPKNHGILYEKQITKLLEGCSDHIRVDFDGSKALVQFGNPNKAQNTFSGVARAVYLAVKLRQENIPMEINLYNPDDAEKKIETIEKKKMDHCAKYGLMQSNEMRINWQPHLAKLAKVKLPGMNQVAIKIIIPNIIDCGNFYAQYHEEENQNKISLLKHTINNLELRPLRSPIEKGSLVLAPFNVQNEGEMYFRGQVEFVSPDRKQAGIFFLDYGNTDEIFISKLRELDYKGEEDLINIPAQAMQCRLACIKPSFNLKTKPGEWAKTANLFFRDNVRDKDLIARIYSVVDRCVNVELFKKEVNGLEISINKTLVAKGLAEDCEEDFLSKENHEHRRIYQEMTSVQQETFQKQQIGARELDYFMVTEKESDLLKESRYDSSGRKLRLRGPFSPLESSFFGISQVSCHKRVRIERDSVNSVTLDAEPHNPHTRMMVASYVCLNSKGDVMNARNTTLMPPIQGLPAIMILLFAPTMELRRNCQKTKYTGAICGLGYDNKTNKSYYRDHDSEIEFDAVIDQEDFVMINILRTCINLVLGDAEKYSITNTNTNIYFADIRKNARIQVKKLLSKPRKTQERMPSREPYRWGLIPEDDYICIDNEGEDPHPEIVKLLPMHKAVVLNKPRDGNIMEKRIEMERLRSRARKSDLPEMNKCVLCNVTTSTPRDLLNHFKETTHIRNEYFIMKDDYSSEEE